MTRQVADKLIYKGEEHPLLGFIPLPKNDERVLKLTDEEFKLLFDDSDKEWSELQLHIDSHHDLKEESYKFTQSESDIFHKHFSKPHIICGSTACWRKYVATWEIKEDVLYLKEIHGKYKLLSDIPIITDWFSDTLKIGLGHLLDSNSILASGDIYLKELHITIESGVVMHTEVVEFNEKYEEPDGSLNNRPKDRRSILRKFLDDDYESI